MNKTKFMEVMFSAVDEGNEALTKQVADDIEAAKQSGEVDTDEVTYINLGEGKVMVIDNVNQECTVVEGEGEEYEMEAMPDSEIEKYIHTLDGTTPDEEVSDGEIESVGEHMLTGVAGNTDNVCPEDMCSQGLLENQAGASDNVPVEREFSVSTRNTAVLKFFSDQAFYEKLMSEVIESEDTAKVGNIKIDKVSEDEVVITDTATGDAAKVAIDGDELEVEELDERNFKEFSALTSEEGEEIDQYEPMFVVGFNPDSHVVVDAPVYSEEDAQELVEHLNDMGVVGVQLFENPDEAREYAHSLLGEEGAVEAEEPVQAEFSDRELYLTRYYSADELEPAYSIFSDPEVDFSDCTDFMIRMFSEAEEGCDDTQCVIEDAIQSGEQVEDDHVIITPVDAQTAVIEDKDNGEYTVATLGEEDIDVEAISEDEAAELTGDLEIEGQEEPEEAEFSETYTRVMHRLYSEENDELPVTQTKIEDAIENGDQVEDEDVIITPIDSETAVIEDKKNDELTKVTLDGEDLHAEEITEEEADELFEDIDVDEDSETDEDEEEEEETPEEAAEREFSERLEAYENMDPLERFFADAAEEMVTIQVPASSIAQAVPEGQVPLVAPSQQGDDVAPAQAPVEGGDSVEMIEDKAIAAVNSIQEAAQQAVELIQEAKQAPVPGADSDIQEAQFSRLFSDPMEGWLSQI